eukprot:418380-Pyramimonas_sp.AAC.1
MKRMRQRAPSTILSNRCSSAGAFPACAPACKSRSPVEQRRHIQSENVSQWGPFSRRPFLCSARSSPGLASESRR